MPFEAQALPVELPPLQPRPRGLLTQVATRVPVEDARASRIMFGAKIEVTGPLEVQLEAVDCEETDRAGGTIDLDWLYTEAFSMWDIFECSTLTNEPERHAALVRRTAQAILSEGLTMALTSVTLPGVLNLAVDSSNLGTFTDIADVLATIENGLAERISNSQGTVFIPPAHLAAAVDAGAVRVFPDRLETATGHKVVSDAGIPLGQFFGTGPVGYDHTTPDILGGDLGQTIPTKNITEWLTVATGLVIFNPNHSVRATYDIDLSS